jgi:enamine deaminase RidA (YjgF/YER057c/UK114 family)
MRLHLTIAGCLALALAVPSHGQEPVRIPAPDGEVVLAGPGEQWLYDNLHFAPLRRAGKILYLSGVVAMPANEAGKGDFKAALRAAFSTIKRQLEAGGSDLAHVDMIQTFHVWDSPLGGGNKKRQFDDFAAVKDEFLKAPYPAWTAVGVTSLLPDDGVVEIQVTAHVPDAGTGATRK